MPVRKLLNNARNWKTKGGKHVDNFLNVYRITEENLQAPFFQKTA